MKKTKPLKVNLEEDIDDQGIFPVLFSRILQKIFQCSLQNWKRQDRLTRNIHKTRRNERSRRQVHRRNLIYLFIYLLIYLFIYLFIYMFNHPFIYLISIYCMLECIETILYQPLWTETDGWKVLKTGWIILIDHYNIQSKLIYP